MTTRETSFREKTIWENNHLGNDRISLIHASCVTVMLHARVRCFNCFDVEVVGFSLSLLFQYWVKITEQMANRYWLKVKPIGDVPTHQSGLGPSIVISDMRWRRRSVLNLAVLFWTRPSGSDHQIPVVFIILRTSRICRTRNKNPSKLSTSRIYDLQCPKYHGSKPCYEQH